MLCGVFLNHMTTEEYDALKNRVIDVLKDLDYLGAKETLQDCLELLEVRAKVV